MAVKTHALFYMRDDGEGANICVQIVHFFCGVQCLGVTFAALLFLCSYVLRVSGKSHNLQTMKHHNLLTSSLFCAII